MKLVAFRRALKALRRFRMKKREIKDTLDFRLFNKKAVLGMIYWKSKKEPNSSEQSFLTEAEPTHDSPHVFFQRSNLQEVTYTIQTNLPKQVRPI
ncbi:hypothetical protein GWI33_002647 [Rhynchophorus ferrugineus]|uniref:Uncharacterized protein n=1 Tax=Rhynchophorus ferrugineus TaxID=354439 RepID=A0A834IRM9_RHYFE|nr:hypothetical protein GWI33_002647 [Rhynchophorus ferrugineus]